MESTNEITVAHDGNRLILNDQELRAQFPGSGSYPAGASPSRPLSINHLLGPSFLEGSSQIFTFVQMNPYNELYLRCGSPANAAETVGPLGHDIIAKIICKQGVGYIMESDTHENHMVNLRGPITLRYLRFKLRGQRRQLARHQHQLLHIPRRLTGWSDERGAINAWRKAMEETIQTKEAAAAAPPTDDVGATAPAPAPTPAPPASPAAQPEPEQPAPKRRGRPPGCKNKPKAKPEAPPTAPAAPALQPRPNALLLLFPPL